MGKCLSGYIGQKYCLGRIILDNISDNIIICNRDYICVYANNNFIEFFNDFDIKIVGQNISDLPPVISEIAGKWKARVDELFITGKVTTYKDYDNIGGNDIYSESTLAPLFDDKANVTAAALTLKNLTEKKQLIKELALNHRLSELGKTLAYLTHEIKTPLNSIIMNIDILSADQTLSRNQLQSILIVQQELRRLGKMMKGILKFVQTSDQLREKVDVKHAVTNAGKLMEPVLREKNIQLNVMVEDLLVLGNEHYIESVLFEMINNSIEAIGANGFINIYSEVNVDEAKVNLFIKDSGRGIDDPDKIFTPFFSTKKEGNGIGLSQIVKTLREMDSSVKLVSSKPGSTLFEIEFNLAGKDGKNINN